jgi:hypothetical protein
MKMENKMRQSTREEIWGEFFEIITFFKNYVTSLFQKKIIFLIFRCHTFHMIPLKIQTHNFSQGLDGKTAVSQISFS